MTYDMGLKKSRDHLGIESRTLLMEELRLTSRFSSDPDINRVK